MNKNQVGVKLILTEAFQFYLLKASNELAKKKVNVNTLIEQNIPIVSYQQTLTRRGRRGCDQKSNLRLGVVKERNQDTDDKTLAQMP